MGSRTPVSISSKQSSSEFVGVKAYSSKTANQGSITTVTDVSDLTVTITCTSSRLYMVQVQAMVLSSVLDDVCLLTITSGSNVAYQRASIVSQNTGFGQNCPVFTIQSGLTGTQTFKLRAERQSGTGSLTVIGGTDYASRIVVSDIGPA